MSNDSLIRKATPEDLPLLQEIRQKAFEPIFKSFRSILGAELYEQVQAREDAAQSELLSSLVKSGSDWEVFVTEINHIVIGFVAIQLNNKTKTGEIGLNAVDPAHTGKGVGTEMYRYVLSHMKQAGMKVATVSAGADPSHAPALSAYKKAGFNIGIPSIWMCQPLD